MSRELISQGESFFNICAHDDSVSYAIGHHDMSPLRTYGSYEKIKYRDQNDTYKITVFNKYGSITRNVKAVFFKYAVGFYKSIRLNSWLYSMGDIIVKIEPGVTINFIDNIIAKHIGIIGTVPGNDVHVSLLKCHPGLMMNIQQVSDKYDRQQLVQAITSEISAPTKIEYHLHFIFYMTQKYDNPKHELHAMKMLSGCQLSPEHREMVNWRISNLLIELDKK